MKVIILFFLLPFSLFAETKLTAYRSHTDSQESLTLTISKKEITLVKKSNWLDRKKDFRLGTLVSSREKFAAEVKALEALAIKHNSQEGPSEAPRVKPHETSFVLNGHIIPQDSQDHKKLMSIIGDFQSQAFTLVEGAQLLSDKSFYVYVKDRKEVSREKFSEEFFCEKGAAPKRCLVRQWGSLLID